MKLVFLSLYLAVPCALKIISISFPTKLLLFADSQFGNAVGCSFTKVVK